LVPELRSPNNWILVILGITILIRDVQSLKPSQFYDSSVLM
jgi:hypothetical protein